MSEGSINKPSPFVDLIAGFASGATCKIYEHPFDTIKVLMQVNPKGVYRNSFDCLRKTVRLYGFSGLFRGIQFPLIGSIAENGLTFFSYGFCKRLLGVKGCDKNAKSQVDADHMTMSQTILSAMGSGASISILLTPVELLKCRLQIEQSVTYSSCKEKQTTVGVIRNVLREEGVRGLFRGLNMTFLREIPGTTIWFVAYELALRPFLQRGYHRQSLPLSAIIAAGAFSGVTYWCAIYPIDTVKSIMQTDQNYLQQIRGSASPLRGKTQYLYHTIKSQGVRGLYSGLGFTMFRAIPSNAILFLSYEYVARVVGRFF